MVSLGDTHYPGEILIKFAKFVKMARVQSQRVKKPSCDQLK
jgi:hypothetical protein